MARGRFIEKKICIDKTVNDLSCFESMLGFTWLITHLDCEGRTYGDPAVVRSLLFPRRTDITVEQVEGFIQEWHDSGLLIWYEVDGDKYIYLPKFKDYQVGLNPDREAKSSIPTHEQVMNQSGVNHEQLAVNVKLSVNDKCKDEDTVNQPNFFSKFQAVIGIPITNNVDVDFLKDLIADYGEEKLLAIAKWLRGKDKKCSSMRTALKSVSHAAENWKEVKPAKSISELIQEA